MAVLACLFGVSVYRRRHFLLSGIRYVFLVMTLYVLTFLCAAKYLWPRDPLKALLLALAVELVAINRWRPRRSRYIPRRHKMAAIARFEMSGERYDPRKHEIDHIVPYARGGTHAADNLRVVPRDRNRGKSARSPWWDVFSR